MRRKWEGMNRTVFLLGLVSFFTDVSSEMLVPIVPQFLKFVVGATALSIGLIEGIAESTASLLRVWAGYLADKSGRPKLLSALGYGLSALSKPFYLGASVWPHVLAIRFADRFGKGIRSAPRDVLLAEASDESTRGSAFGFHRAMDTAGAALGPLLVLGLVWLLAGQADPQQLGSDRTLYRYIFLAAALPAVLGWLVLVLFVDEKQHDPKSARKPELRLSVLDHRFKRFLAVATFFAIGNSSDAFLILRSTTQPVGMSLVHVLMVYSLFNVCSAIVAARSGVVSDRIGRKPLIIAGWLVFAVVYLGMARASAPLHAWIWFLVYGVYYGLTEGMLRAFAIDLAPEQMRGTAVGAYFTLTGLALLPASALAGYLWVRVSPSAPFYFSAAVATVSAVMMAALIKTPRLEQPQGPVGVS